MGADGRLRFGPGCAVLVAGDLLFAAPETTSDGFAFELGRAGLLFELIGEPCGWGHQVGVYCTSSASADLLTFTLLREVDGVGSTSESESEITS